MLDDINVATISFDSICRLGGSVRTSAALLRGGGGFSSGKIAYLWTKREELFTGRESFIDSRIFLRPQHGDLPKALD